MQDAIIKGIGNSRYLKTVGEALSLYPTYEDFMQAMVAGIFPVDFNGINKDGWTQQGTLLNKANLLSDTVISTLGLSTGADSTPNDAFNVLANIGNVHVWRKTVVTEEEIPAGYRLVDDTTNRNNVGDQTVSNALIFLIGDTTAELKYSTEITVNENGVVNLNSVISTNSVPSPVTVLNGKYIQLRYSFGKGPVNLDTNKIYYIPSDATVTLNSNNNGWILVNKLQYVDAYPAVPPGTHVTYLTSTNRNAYQEGDDAKEAGYVLGKSKEYVCTAEVQTTAFFRVLYAQSVDVSPDGEVSLHEPQYSSSFSLANEENSAGFCNSNVRGKFCSFELTGNIGIAQGTIVYIPDSATFTVEIENSKRQLNVNEAQTVTGYPAIPAGTTIEYLGVLGEKSKIQVLSYVGTGTSGEANACSVTASFPIEVLFFLGYTGTIYSDPDATGIVNGYWGDRETGVMFGKYLTTTFAERMAFNGNNGMSLGKKSADGKTFYWYNRTAVVTNASGLSYYFLALG